MTEKKKAVPKKKVVVKKKVETKKTTNSRKSNQNSFVGFISSYRFLYTSLAVLFVIVVILGIMVYFKGKEYNKNHANLVFPVLEEKVHNTMNIDLNELKKKKQYVVKITNYRGTLVNQEEVVYSLTIQNTTDVKIEITKGKNSTNLITDQKSTKLENITLKAKEKQDDIYYIRILDSSKLKKKDKISIEIDS